MHSIAVDLIGRFKLFHQGHQYAFIVIEILPNYTWCILLYTKEVDKVVNAYLVNAYAKFGGSQEIFSDNGTDFKYKLFTQVASALGMKQVLSSPYYPLHNGYIKNVHYFLKTCIQMHVSSKLALDEVSHSLCSIQFCS